MISEMTFLLILFMTFRDKKMSILFQRRTWKERFCSGFGEIHPAHGQRERGRDKEQERRINQG